MKPKPFASLNHFTFPVAMTGTFLRGRAPCCSRRDGGVIRRHWRTNKDAARTGSRTARISNLETPNRRCPELRSNMTHSGRAVNRIRARAEDLDLPGLVARYSSAGNGRDGLPYQLDRAEDCGNHGHDRRRDAYGQNVVQHGVRE